MTQTGLARWWFVAGAFIGLSWLGKYPGVLLSPVVFSYLITSPRQRHWLLKPQLWLAALLALLLTFNETKNVVELRNRVAAAPESIDWEMMFVVDDSPDGAAEALRDGAGRPPRALHPAHRAARAVVGRHRRHARDFGVGRGRDRRRLAA